MVKMQCRIPHEERLNFAKHHIAMGCFSRTKYLCQYLIANIEALDEEIVMGILTGISVTYGKPFHRSQGISRLREDIIPTNYLAVHKQIMDFRDKLFAHSDTNGKVDKIDAFLINTILHIDGGYGQWQSISPTPSLEFLDDLIPLCDILSEFCRPFVTKFNKEYVNTYNLANGYYTLNIRESSGPDFAVFDNMQTL